MRENLTYGLTRVQGKQSFKATAPLSYSTISNCRDGMPRLYNTLAYNPKLKPAINLNSYLG